MLENSLHASVDVISREIRFMSVNPGFVEFDGSFQVMLFHIPKLISGVDISSKSAEVVYGFDPDKSEESYRYIMDLYALDGDYCVFRWTIPFTFFAKKRWAFFQVRIRTTSGTTVESQWSTKLKKVYVTPGFTGGQEAYTQAQQDAIAALNSRVTALEASGGGSGSIQLQVDQTPTENSQNLVTSGGVYKAIQEIEPSGSSEDSRIPTPTADDNGKVLGVVNGVYALKTDETGSGGSGEDSRIPTPTASDNGKVLGVVNGVYALKTDETGSGGSGVDAGTWEDVTSVANLTLLTTSTNGTIFYSTPQLNDVQVFYNSGLKMAFVSFRIYCSLYGSNRALNYEEYDNEVRIGQSAYAPMASVFPSGDERAISANLVTQYQHYIEGHAEARMIRDTSYTPNTNYFVKVLPASTSFSSDDAQYNIYVTAMYPCSGA